MTIQSLDNRDDLKLAKGITLVEAILLINMRHWIAESWALTIEIFFVF